MWSTFTLKTGDAATDVITPRHLVIRSADMRKLKDTGDGVCKIWWQEEGYDGWAVEEVMGTALENLERLRQEELAMVAAAERLRERHDKGLPIVPIQRGRKL